MTTQQLYLFNGMSLVILFVVAVLTRATARRIAGALAGGAASGVVALENGKGVRNLNLKRFLTPFSNPAVA